MSDVVKQALLERRFDTASANHVARLWERVASSVNAYLLEVGHKIGWECEEIEVAFDKLENAPLMALLSEGDHPTDGNDVLFVIINSIIGEYNSFARRLADCVNSDEAPSGGGEEVHPKFVATGCGGAVAISTVMPLSLSYLNMIVAGYWESNKGRYNLEGLGTALQREIGLHRSPPTILNPSECLRERFRFRDEQSQPLVGAGTNVSVFVGEEGDYFANHQDHHLASGVWQSLRALEMTVGDADIRRAFSDNFHCFDYNQLRLMLEGCRNLLASVSMAFIEIETVGEALRDTTYGPVSSFTPDEALRSLGYPDLIPSHVQLLTSLNSCQLVELVRFLSFQLASESHLFATLPLCMTDPLKDAEREQIDSRLERLCEDHGSSIAVESIEEFTRDILSFYESPIRDAASSNRSLKSFLAEENFCDDNDRIFAILPTSVSVHNYVALRQHLHQRKLAFLSSEPSGTTVPLRNVDSKTVELFTRPSRGKCWLWQDGEMDGQEPSNEESETQPARYDERWSLWFESGRNDADVQADHDCLESVCEDETVEDVIMDDAGTAASAASMDVDEYVEDGVDLQEQATMGQSASIVQHWWRRHSSQFRDDAFLDEEVNFDDIFEDVDDDEDISLFDAKIVGQDPSTQAMLHDEVNATSSMEEDIPSAQSQNQPPGAATESVQDGSGKAHTMGRAPAKPAGGSDLAEANAVEPAQGTSSRGAHSSAGVLYGSAEGEHAM